MGEARRDRSDYAYGHSELAGDRLQLLATLFEPTTRSFLDRRAPAVVGTAVDLGCGPGYTTALLSEATNATRTVGLEFAPEFVARARDEHATPTIEFVEHDVTAPFPIEVAPDLAYARYLLAHLVSPLDVVRGWVRQLSAGGRLLLEEVERIDTSRPLFARYLGLTAAALAASGTDLYIGGALGANEWPDEIEMIASETVENRPATRDVATMFSMNFATWRHDAWVTANADASELEAIATELDALRSTDATDEITWILRQVTLTPVGA